MQELDAGFVARPSEELVRLGTALHGTRFDTVGPIAHTIVGDETLLHFGQGHERCSLDHRRVIPRPNDGRQRAGEAQLPR